MKRLIIGAAVLAGLIGATVAYADDGIQKFTVCGDPGNMPLSNNKGQGFENALGRVLGNALGTGVNFQWWPSMGRGTMRKTLGAGLCDVWFDMDPHTEGAATTVPLYRSTFVLVTRKDEHIHIKDLDDPILKKLKIGVYEMSAIREALTEHGVSDTQVHYVTYDGDINPKDQPSYQVQLVADGKLDAAAIWGPMAGYYVAKKHEPLVLQPLNRMQSEIPLQFDMALAIPRGNPRLKTALEEAMRTHKDALRKVLTDYGVPLVACKECVISGDIPSHGPYGESAPSSTQTASADTDDTEGDSRLADLKKWLAQGADPNQELQDAIVANDMVRVKYLLAHGADVNNVDNAGHSALSNATRFGFDNIADELVQHGANVNLRDQGSWTPLMYAAWDDDPAMVKTLTAKGADINAKDSKGLTPLAIAAQNGKSKSEVALIGAGADVNQSIAGGGYTPLMLAAITGSTDAAEKLLQGGAKINASNTGGVTALMIATAYGHEPVVKLLLSKGADANARTEDGRTALSIAEQRNYASLVKLLEQATASKARTTS